MNEVNASVEDNHIIIRGYTPSEKSGYKIKMLSENEIKGILPAETRQINGEKQIYIDITGRESLSRYLGSRLADACEIEKLFEAIYHISLEAERFLIEEEDLRLNPDMIFKNHVTGDFEFICLPADKESNLENSGMKHLIRCLLMHLDNSNERLVKVMYSISQMYECSSPKCRVAYEYFCEEAYEKETVTEQEEELQEDNTEPDIYIPSFKELLAGFMCLAGAILLGINLYIRLLTA